MKVFARIWLGSFKMAGKLSVGSYCELGLKNGV